MNSLWQISFLFCCFGIVQVAATSQWNKYIHVNPTSGNNSTGCGTLTSPCRNLSYALWDSHRAPSTMYLLSPGTHYLDNTTYYNPFALNGIGMRGNASVVECMRPNAGLSFVGASNIVLEDIQFLYCASLQKSTSRDFRLPLPTLRMFQFYVGLYFYLCENVSMTNVAVRDSPSATGVVMFDTNGTITINQSNFTNNRVEQSTRELYPGGGGFYIEFTYCLPGDNNCNNTLGPYTSANSNSSYRFTHCTFSYNANQNIPGHYYSWFVLPRYNVHSAFGRGGGLSVFFKGNATNNKFTVTNCTFEHNTGMWGGGLALHLLDDVNANTVTIENCTFRRNWLHFKKGSSGGGIDIVYCVLGNIGGNTILINGSRLFNNSASIGGGFSVLAARQNTTKKQTATVLVQRTIFHENKAGLGAAAVLSRYMVVLSGEMMKIEFNDSSFTNNSVVSKSHTYLEGVGAVYIDKMSVNFRGNITFRRNWGSALGVVGTHVSFSSCSVSFESNIGYQGGAIALLGSAWILLDSRTSMNFTKNKAYAKGGAIYNKYVEKEDMSVFPNCFLNYEIFKPPNYWNCSFFFEDNNAGLHGKSIYSTSILPCTSGNPDHYGRSSTFCWNNWNYRRNGTNSSCDKEIGSDVGNISFTIINNKTFPIETFPGKVFSIPLDVRDDLHRNITENTVFIATTSRNNQQVNTPKFAYVSHTSGAIVLGQGNSDSAPVVLELDTVTDRVWHINIEVKLNPCPPGFTSSPGRRRNARCICSLGNYGGQLTCHQENYTSRLANQFWLGPSPYDPNHTLVIASCPEGLCYSDLNESTLLLPNATHELNHHICGRMKRTGTMCGKCLRGYAPAVNSDTFKCVQYNDTNVAVHALFYILSVYAPLFILFTVIIVFNIRLTTGPAIAFILYSQVISSTFYPNADGHIPLNTLVNHSRRLTNAYRRSYGIFNLEFVENLVKPFCLGGNLNTLDVLQLNYIVALFPLLMIILVLGYIRVKAFILAKCWRSRGRLAVRTQQVTYLARKWKLGESLLHAFAAFILLSYTKFSLTSSYIVIFQHLLDEHNKKVAGPPRVFFAGQYATNDPEYKSRYLFPAIIVYATFVAIPPLLLLHYPLRLFESCINRVRCIRRLYPADKVHILLDTFQGCYRNNMRFFAGLYFIFRLIMHVSYIMTAGMLVQFTVQQVVCTSFAILVALCRPYTRDFLNYVDSLIFANLAIINSLSLFLCMYAQMNQGQRLPLAPFIIQYILIFLPWVYMIGFVIWYLMSPRHAQIKTLIGKCLRSNTVVERREQEAATECLHNVTRDRISRTDIADIDREISEAPTDDMEALLRRAERENLYRAPQVGLLHQLADGEGKEEKEVNQSGLLFSRGQQVQYGSTN